jgi:diguanylate cyclase (GGDEF)-like protein/PAS domain S-box-containing protein
MKHSNDRYLLNCLLDNLPEHFYFKDTESRFIRISRSLASAFGLEDPKGAIGKSDFDFFSEEHARLAFENEKEIMRTGRTMSIEEKETWPDRPDTWVLTTKMPLLGENGRVIGTYGISRDITDRKIAEDKLQMQSKSLQKQIHEINQLHEQLREQACRDTLTGLSNRRMMDTILNQQIEQCRQLDQPLSILIIDIDDFKNVNDEYGHLAGDAFLVKFGDCIRSLTRTEDFSCRIGGDEILMTFQNMDLDQAMKKAEILHQKLCEVSIDGEGEQISTTVSIGIAAYPAHGDDVNQLIKQADEALYLAKERGRNQVATATDL